MGNTTINTVVDTLPHTYMWQTHFLPEISRQLESSLKYAESSPSVKPLDCAFFGQGELV